MTNLTFARPIAFLPVLLVATAVFALNAYVEPNSLKFFAIKGLISTYLALMFLAVAQTVVIFSGDIDLSVGAIVGLVNVSVVTLMNVMGGSPAMVLLAMVAGIGVGALCGFINGILVVQLRLQAIVATFASAILFTGLALWILPVAGLPVPSAYWRTYSSSVATVPLVFWIAIALVILVAALSRTRLLLEILSVGDNRRAAFQTGLPVNGLRIKGYVLCGVLSACAALCITGDTASGDPNVGSAMTLNSVAAAVLGGTALSGGKGSLFGSILGALTIGLIGSLVFFLGTPSEWQNLVHGLTILAALMFGILVGRRG